LAFGSTKLEVRNQKHQHFRTSIRLRHSVTPETSGNPQLATRNTHHRPTARSILQIKCEHFDISTTLNERSATTRNSQPVPKLRDNTISKFYLAAITTNSNSLKTLRTAVWYSSKFCVRFMILNTLLPSPNEELKYFHNSFKILTTTPSLFICFI
jgi:hypothetical protein